ncbi:30S ribosomal protein S15 [Candidatus Vidania fulgoroideorum]
MGSNKYYITKLNYRISNIQAHIRLHKKDFNSLRCVKRLFIQRRKYLLYKRKKSNVVKW